MRAAKWPSTNALSQVPFPKITPMQCGLSFLMFSTQLQVDFLLVLTSSPLINNQHLTRLALLNLESLEYIIEHSFCCLCVPPIVEQKTFSCGQLGSEEHT